MEWQSFCGDSRKVRHHHNTSRIDHIGDTVGVVAVGLETIGVTVDVVDGDKVVDCTLHCNQCVVNALDIGDGPHRAHCRLHIGCRG